MRTCETCGQPITFGCMTDGSGDWYTHEGPCFYCYMDKTYGEHNWMCLGGNAEDGEGGYYLASDANEGYSGTGIYYTEYEEDDEEDDGEYVKVTPRDTCLVEVVPSGDPPSYRELISVQAPKGLTKVGEAWFTDRDPIKFIIHEGVTRLDVSTAKFQCWKSLNSVTIPDGIEEIGGGAFMGCSNLTNVHIPRSVKSIELYAFSGCSSLRSLVIPDSVTYIGEHAFEGCSNLLLCAIPGSYLDTYARENAFVLQKKLYEHLPNCWRVVNKEGNE